ncbi:MAG: hypothetical protein HYY24_23885 [Verrucomicrobia bacterium]|nr:hypothetical protein [Verrucomicrobiota bacterium]
MTTLLRTGIYTIPEASRLTRVSPWRIRRWLKGYEFESKSGRHRSPAVWRGQLDPIDHKMALGFHDLLEIRCVDAFLNAGVGWKTLRQAHKQARKISRHPHPFCSNRFATDGKDIFLELREDDGKATVWDAAKLQGVFDRVIEPFLKNLEFGQGEVPTRWWPRGKDHCVALDPRRNFGQPSIFERGIPTRILNNSVRANGSLELVALWFETDVRAVQEAVEFEQQLAA